VANEVARRGDAAFESAPAEALVARVRGQAPLLVVKPLTFMNLSGAAVGAMLRYYRIAIADLLVVTDDVNLPLGRLRARPGGSAGGHNGLKSVAEHLGTEEYARLRVGVGRGDERRDLADHVLAGFDADERPEIEGAVMRAADAVDAFVAEGIEAVMNRFNADPAKAGRQQLPEEDSGSTKDGQS
jgi:peptidyl-tRNA hydrolase, PTH1 family